MASAVDVGLRQEAAQTMQRAWLGYKNRQMFRLLKATVRAAEQSLTPEILRKVVPREAEFFRLDAFVKLKLRFRFGGENFPPLILYKVYLDSSSCAVRYVNGRRAIQPHSQAAQQSAEMMGNRKYYDLMLQDCLHRLQNGVVDDCDVTTVKDHMHLLAVLDETRPEFGGKDNGWRQLTSRCSPRYTVFRDVVEFLATRRMTERLQQHLPLLTALPSSQEIRREQLRILAEVEAPRLAALGRPRLARTPAGTARRSRGALTRAQRMRRAYLAEGDADAALKAPTPSDGVQEAGQQQEGFLLPGADSPEEDFDEDEDEDFEEEADQLYEWTKELTMEQLGSPRLA